MRRLLLTSLLSWTITSVATELPFPDADRIARLDPQVQQVIQQAVERYQRASAESTGPEHKAAALLSLAKLMHAHDEVATARAAYQQALVQRPEDFEATYLLAMLELGEGRVDAALAGFERALSLRSDYAALWVRLGNLRLAAGQLEGAQAAFESALKQDVDSAAAKAGLGQLALQRGEHQAARDWLQAALALQPAASRLQVALGLAHRNLGELDKAREVLAQRGDQDVIVTDPVFAELSGLRQNPAVFFEQARALVKEGRSDQALPLFARAVEMAPEDPPYLYEYGRSLLQLGQAAEAESVLGRAWQHDAKSSPDAALIALLRATIAGQNGDRASQIARLQEAIALDPSGDDIRVELAHLLFKAGQYPAAAEHFDQLTARSSDAAHNYALYWAGLAHGMAGNCELAERALSKVLSASGGRDGWAMFGLARLRASCAASGADLQQAAAWADSLYRQYRSAETIEGLAMVRAAEGDFAAALGLIDEALELARQNGESLDYLADLEALKRGFAQRQKADRPYSPHSATLRQK